MRLKAKMSKRNIWTMFSYYSSWLIYTQYKVYNQLFHPCDPTEIVYMHANALLNAELGEYSQTL